jgi:hypothetical protein
MAGVIHAIINPAVATSPRAAWSYLPTARLEYLTTTLGITGGYKVHIDQGASTTNRAATDDCGSDQLATVSIGADLDDGSHLYLVGTGYDRGGSMVVAREAAVQSVHQQLVLALHAAVFPSAADSHCILRPDAPTRIVDAAVNATAARVLGEVSQRNWVPWTNEKTWLFAGRPRELKYGTPTSSKRRCDAVAITNRAIEFQHSKITASEVHARKRALIASGFGTAIWWVDGNIFASTYTVVFTDGNKLHLQLDPGPGAKSNNATLTAFGIGTIIDYGNRDAVLTVTVNWGDSLWLEVTPLALVT